ALSVTSNFFDLGGTSLDLINLVYKIKNHFSIDASITTILQYPTAKGLSEFISNSISTTSRKTYNPIVSLQSTGDKRPVFCIHSAIGEVLVFVNLSKYFAGDRPFYALRTRGLDKGFDYFSSIDEMVDCYVEAIRKIQPHGPYAISGYSFGGFIAFEVAKRLEMSGENVPFIGIIDCAPSTDEPICPDYCALSLGFFLGLIDKKKMLELHEKYKGSDPDLCKLIFSISNKKRIKELDLDLEKFTEWMDVASSLGMMGKDYKPTGMVNSVNVFYAEPRWENKFNWLNNKLMKWDDYTIGDNNYIEVEGEHHSLLDPEYVSSFQSKFRKSISDTIKD
ncbi:non-ribosomal peptide synthetase, partial [Vibrio mediterranei]|uniref:thioesterase domain-containing protein n=1 Tax=Vibrio mediterranei TaxID=689 RepID=UPI001EFD5474